VRENWFTGMGEEYKNKKQKKIKTVTVPIYVAPKWRLDRSSDPTKFGRAGNVITHAKFQIN